jgi:hypothetical protein
VSALASRVAAVGRRGQADIAIYAQSMPMEPGVGHGAVAPGDEAGDPALLALHRGRIAAAGVRSRGSWSWRCITRSMGITSRRSGDRGGAATF